MGQPSPPFWVTTVALLSEFVTDQKLCAVRNEQPSTLRLWQQFERRSQPGLADRKDGVQAPPLIIGSWRLRIAPEIIDDSEGPF